MSLDSDSKKISLYQFEPLDEGNYQEWQTRMVWKLEELELEQHIDPSMRPPTQDEKEEWATWSKDDRRAMRTIGGHLSSINVAKIAECKTAMEIWKLLQSEYCIQGSMGNFHIWTRLRTNTLQENSDLAATQAFLDEHRKLRSQAAANNWIVPDDILAMSILSGLPPSWSPWIEATTSHYHLLNKPLASKDMSEGILQRSRTLLVLSDEAEAKTDGVGKVMNISGDTNTMIAHDAAIARGQGIHRQPAGNYMANLIGSKQKRSGSSKAINQLLHTILQAPKGRMSGWLPPRPEAVLIPSISTLLATITPPQTAIISIHWQRWKEASGHGQMDQLSQLKARALSS